MLSPMVERHIALHQTTGYLFRSPACLLRSFAQYADARGDEIIRSETIIEWAAQAPTAGTCRGRLHTLRRFARLMQSEDQRHEIPPPDLFGPLPPRREPYIFQEQEIRALLEAANALGSPKTIHSKTYSTLFGLIASTGLRVSEAIALQIKDITVDGLVIRETKFRKNRLVVLHGTTRQALENYLAIRETFAAFDTSVFLLSRGKGLAYSTTIAVFLRLVRKIGIHSGPGKKGPRIHDLRHTFAVRSLERCSGNREAVARHMQALSTYLGHTHLSDTYWYLQATPRLLTEVATQSEALAFGGTP